MVLAILIFILNLGFSDSTLLDKYEKQINKSINKELGLETNSFESKAFSRGELYEIQSNDKLQGYLLISEVAACRLGGCSSFEKINSKTNLNSSLRNDNIKINLTTINEAEKSDIHSIGPRSNRS